MRTQLFDSVAEAEAHNARLQKQARERMGLGEIVDSAPPIRKTLICVACGVETPRTGPVQKYCEPCSAAADMERKAKWSTSHPADPAKVAAWGKAGKENRRVLGAARNEAERERLGISEEPDLEWMVRVAVPYHASVSKNFIWSGGNVGGHRFLRRESREFRNAVRDSLVVAMGRRRAVQNKLWLDIYVEKPTHKLDAVNTVDLICDGVKEALGVDDRWFCIRRLDWQINKINPKIWVGVGQEWGVEASQICSYCGAIRPLHQFGVNRAITNGKHRVCRLCSSIKTPPAVRA